MTGFRSRWTAVRGVRIHDLSRPGGPDVPIVLVHGLAVAHRYLMPTARALPARHPVLVPDLPGFGRSDKPGRALDVEEHAQHVAGWLDALRLGPVCLVGHSFGSEVVARVAVRRPAAVAALVLAGPTTDPRARSRRRLIGRWLATMVAERPGQVPTLLRDVADTQPWRVLATIGHSVRNPVEEDLRRLPVPPLVLGGAQDAVAPLRWRAEVAAMTGGTLVTLPYAAHNALTTSGRRSAAAIAAHLRRTCAGPNSDGPNSAGPVSDAGGPSTARGARR